jgi:hypothetical protein
MLAGEVFPERTPGVEVRRCVCALLMSGSAGVCVCVCVRVLDCCWG